MEMRLTNELVANPDALLEVSCGDDEAVDEGH